MNKIVRNTRLTPFEADYALWSIEQAALLRAGRIEGLDRENLAEEIESLGRSQEDEIESRLGVLLHHLLKWQFQPEEHSNSWRATILEQRMRIRRRIRKSPSLRGYPASILEEEYAPARLMASGETGLPEDAFPITCPFTIEQILDPDFLPEAD